MPVPATVVPPAVDLRSVWANCVAVGARCLDDEVDDDDDDEVEAGYAACACECECEERRLCAALALAPARTTRARLLPDVASCTRSALMVAQRGAVRRRGSSAPEGGGSIDV